MKQVLAIALTLAVVCAFTTIPVKKVEESSIQKMLRLNYLQNDYQSILNKFLPTHLTTTWPEVKINNFMDA